MRIVSLLPGATEILGCLGLEESLVGVSHACDYPHAILGLPRVTRSLLEVSRNANADIDAAVRTHAQARQPLYTLDRAAIRRLQPDLILTQSLCHVCAVANRDIQEAVASLPRRPIILSLEPSSLESVVDSVHSVADAAGVGPRGAEVAEQLRRRIQVVADASKSIDRRPRVAVLEWIDPPFSAGHWTPEMIALAGGDEVLGKPQRPSETITWPSVHAADPEVLFLACCGYSLQETLVEVRSFRRRAEWTALRAVRTGRVYLLDGNAYLSRPGPRLVDALEIIAHQLHPQIHPDPGGDYGPTLVCPP